MQRLVARAVVAFALPFPLGTLFSARLRRQIAAAAAALLHAGENVMKCSFDLPLQPTPPPPPGRQQG